jgi:hypothetical protein
LVKAKDKTSKPQSMTASNGSKTSWQSPQIKVIKSDYLQLIMAKIGATIIDVMTCLFLKNILTP